MRKEGEIMSGKELLAIDIRTLNENAQHLFEVTDIGGLEVLFGDCKNVNEINNAADDYCKEWENK